MKPAVALIVVSLVLIIVGGLLIAIPVFLHLSARFPNPYSGMERDLAMNCQLSGMGMSVVGVVFTLTALIVQRYSSRP
jgi:hypothetical protein